MSIKNFLKKKQKQLVSDNIKFLKKEVKEIYDLIQDEIDNFYNDYQPSIYYERTDSFRNSLYIDDFIDIDLISNQLKITIKFNDDAYHSSMFGYEDVFIPHLLNSGYQVKKGWHKNIENFGYRKGYHFVEKALKRYSQQNRYGITVVFIETWVGG